MDGDAVLRHAGPDGIDYDAIKGDDLDAALEAIATADIRLKSPDEQYAFLINAYNIVSLDAVRRRLYRDGKRVGSLQNPFTWLRFFLFTPVVVAGRKQSLYSLEFFRLKPHLRRDPRGHFALVCASAGCPPLRDGIYHAETLSEELDAAGRAFMQSAEIDEEREVLKLNKIMKWYAKDFAVIGNAREMFLRYGPPEKVAWTKRVLPDLEWLPYDWDLNIKS